MIRRILLGILCVANVSAMQNSLDKNPSAQKSSNPDLASRKLYHVMIRAHCIINKTSLLGNEDGFDPSEKSLLPRVQSLLSEGADPNYRLAFMVPMGVGEKVGWPLPTSMELAQGLKYQEIVSLFPTPK